MGDWRLGGAAARELDLYPRLLATPRERVWSSPVWIDPSG